MNEFRNGWRELTGATIGLACGIGCYTPVSSFFLRALEREFGWSKTAAAASFIALPLTALLLPFTGKLLDRFGVRRVAFISVLLLSACFFLLSAMNGQLAFFYAAFFGLWIFGSATGPIGYTRTIAQCFKRSRGAALAIALLGIASAGMILPPVIASVITGGGWRDGYRLLAMMALVGGCVAILLIRSLPVARSASEAGAENTLGHVVRRPEFWLLGLSIFCISVGCFGFISQFQSIVIEKGIAIERAPLLLSLVAASVFVSRLVVGFLLDTARAELVSAGVLLLAGVGAAVWLLGPSTFGMALIAVLLLAMSIGAELDLMSFFCARLFGVRHYAAAYGALAIFFYCGIAVGGIAYGAIHDKTGSYSAGIAASCILFVVSAILFLMLRPASNRALAASKLAAS